MIPVVSISNLISALFFTAVVAKLHSSYKKTKDEKIKDFFLSFLFLSLTLFLLATPGLIFTDLEVIGLVFSIYPLFLFISLIFLAFIPLKILRWQKMRRAFLFVTIVTILIITTVNLANLSPAAVHNQDNFIYWEDPRGMLIDNVIGLTLGAWLLLVISLFIFHGFKSKDKYVRLRASFIAIGLLILLAEVVVNFIFGAVSNIYITSVIASSLGILAGIIMLLGVLYKYHAKSDRGN